MITKKASMADEFISVSVKEAIARLVAIPNLKGPSATLGKYSLFLNVTANQQTLYIPVSIASGRKSTGFIYHIEGTDQVTSRATADCRGEGTAIITSGTISYCKIPPGKTASFKLLAEVDGARAKKYKFVISRINYKLNPNDLRYKRFLTEISTNSLKFR